MLKVNSPHFHVYCPQPPDDVNVDTGSELGHIHFGSKGKRIACLVGAHDFREGGQDIGSPKLEGTL